MKKTLLLLAFVLFIASCGIKNTQTLISEGNYDTAIDRAVEGLRSNKNAKGKQDYIYLLEEAFAKAKERDLSAIRFWEQEANPQNLEKIYTTYVALADRQNQIAPLLPLQLLKENKNAKFIFSNYNTEIINSKQKLSSFLYDNSKALLLTKNKANARRAFDDLVYLNRINPNFKETNDLMIEAQSKGTDYVKVSLQNDTNQLIPLQLQKELMDFNTYGLDQKWTIFDSSNQKGVSYDYGLILNFNQIDISPEQIKEKEFVKEKQIKDGVKALVDSRGKVVKDSLGKPIMVDNLKTIQIRIYEFYQFKACYIAANVNFIDLKSNRVLESFPIATESVFENTYATYKGDRRATESEYYTYFDRRALPFPNNEQMVYDTAQDLKAKFKTIISRNNFTGNR
ncbi:hypothetical protein H8R23_13380 [Flavobacterium sp. F-380]|uniref:Lipoprotein n=1 Tax=Flavobacterium kayseriense TaxID=2764714 RepID=A0ABR7JA40_9FLAO|nr:hypothetical protein [Flavobacterium kayseriense]MBC5842403.1 hypothetical protein [Flavobacterium kayseriense]MBC5848933.1 hypothetical protein [Flavobacterium kayseriense]